MKIISIKNNNGDVISPGNIKSDEELDSWINQCISTKVWGEPERIVRAKVQLEDESFLFPDEVYDESDVLETIEATEQLEAMVRLKAEYTIEISDYKKVPKSVTRRQSRRALHQAGLLEAIENYMVTAPMEIKIDWSESQEIQRNWSSLPIVANALNLTENQIDDLFILAETL
ncbi:hypothetical protein [Leptospira bandrabouensis]|uniref:Uncharacterized protein n=1 Tax=Leptospira bandrabouensis TaxID=2484903 RepID=A0A6H3NST7_9LEPT|nr:hypothetical protein [Leptospira bandrabouensis]TGN09979.1 hypothetical protein EHR07_00435 [Leptospira bandrabouensis]TGN12363.1 hypothetical protein EHR08_13355 [Leptospira bandrabouensis]